MDSSFQNSVKILYREFMKTVYRMESSQRSVLLNKIRLDFKQAAKIPRKNIQELEFMYHKGFHDLYLLRQADIVSFKAYTPKAPK